MTLEFLVDSPELRGGKIQVLPTDGKVSAINIPHASMVFDLHKTIDITADLLNGGGRATETVRYADIVCFTCLKAFAFDQRFEPKDAHDLVYCLENYEGGTKAAQDAFRIALNSKHGRVIRDAIDRLAVRFCDPNVEESYLRDGPVAVARFEYEGVDGDEEVRNARVLRRRRAADAIAEFLRPFLNSAADP